MCYSVFFNLVIIPYYIISTIIWPSFSTSKWHFSATHHPVPVLLILSQYSEYFLYALHCAYCFPVQFQLDASIGRFYATVALSVWTNSGKHFVLCLVMRFRYNYGYKTHYASRRTIVIRRLRRITKDSSSTRIMRLVPVSIRQGHPTAIFGKYLFGRRFEI